MHVHGILPRATVVLTQGEGILGFEARMMGDLSVGLSICSVYSGTLYVVLMPYSWPLHKGHPRSHIPCRGKAGSASC